MIGGIDGSHIKLIALDDEEIPYAYVNYKKYNSIVLLAVVGNSGRCTWFCTRCPGSCTDSGVLQTTVFYKMAQADHSQPVRDRKLFTNGSCILSEKAFAEMPWMRKPITLPKKRSERYFNHKHSGMIIPVQEAFGRLKWTFQALQHGLKFKLEDAPIIVDACLVLYNFMHKHEGYQPSIRGHVNDAQRRNGTGRARGET